MYIGMPVHLTGPRFGCVWKIIGFHTDELGEVWLQLQTPVTGKISWARASRARYIRAHEPVSKRHY